MENNGNTILKKMIVIFLITIITYASFILIGSNIANGLISYAAEEEETSSSTKSKGLMVIPNNSSKANAFADEIKKNDGRDFCIEKSVWRYKDATYVASGTEIYPKDDSKNGYAKAYVYAAKNYIKSTSGETLSQDDVQDAIWIILKQQSGDNALSYLAKAYQSYKKNEEALTIQEEPNAKLLTQGDKLIYGPFKIMYSYSYANKGSFYDQWGGFAYAFFDSEDENANNVCNETKICTLIDGEYQEIESSLITTDNEVNGYYEVNTDQYNGNDLYIVTTNKQLSKIYLRIRDPKIEYEAKVTKKKGSVTYKSSGLNLCSSCKSGVKVFEGRYWKQTNTSTYKEWGEDKIEIKGNQLTEYEYYIKTEQKKQAVYGKCKLIKKGNLYWCRLCGFTSLTNLPGNCPARVTYKTVDVDVSYCDKTVYEEVTGCGTMVGPSEKDGYFICGSVYRGGTHDSQAIEVVDYTSRAKGYGDEILVEIELGATIEVTKKWEDYDNKYSLRPETLRFNVFRSTDQQNWEKVPETDYNVEIKSKENSTWKILISGLVRVDDAGKEYYFKVEEQELTCYKATYPDGNYPEHDENSPTMWYIDIENSLKQINIGGYVWLDGQTGIKPVVPNNGIMDNSETRLENIVVYLYYKNPTNETISKIAETVTDKNGHYEFKDYGIGHYYVEFYYDGIHYEDTISGGSSKAFEKDASRNTFNGRFQTITYGKSNDGTILKYNYADNKSTLITNEDGKTTIKPEFQMTAETSLAFITTKVNNLNLGLVKRGTDIALSTDVYDAQVAINGQVTDYIYNKDDNSLEIGTTQTSEKVTYNLNLYTSDYNYRVRDYANSQDFKEKDYINDGTPGVKTGDDLKVNVIYELNLQNQSTETTRINEVKYTYDTKYSFIGIKDSSYATQNLGNVITINLNGLSLGEGETKTLYLVFEVNETDNNVSTGDFSNKAEITSYSTDKGLIDVDSQPGNFVNDNQTEDDSDTAGGLTIKTEDSFERKITGKVFDQAGNNVNDVIVQLIELKTVNGKTYEYIWQETVSGTENGLRLNANGTALETYSYSKADGYYEFKGFIPGNYIVRFIYGDGTTYDMTGNVIKYNGQDYKSMTDSNYNSEWYNKSSYSTGSSVARDNEARRLETMAYSVEIDAEKGVLLKLLNNLTVDDLNETEKETIIATYNKMYNPDITQVTNEVINKLLKEQVLKNTWMCAETSTIKVAVETENVTNINSTTTVNGKTGGYVKEISNINLGLELRPETKIELKKYITGFKLTALDGTTLVNAYVDVNEYLNGATDISNKVQGIRDNVTILDTVWQYEVSPTNINTVVDGAKLEFEYTLVVKNTGETDYLSSELANVYNNSDIETYKTTLTNKAAEIKGYMRSGTYRDNIGNSVGSSYYLGGTGTGKVLTEVTNIRDYINNDLKFIASGGKVEIDEDASHTHRILRDDYSIQAAQITTILKTTETTGKMENNGAEVLYTVTLGKNPISSTGNLNFENYIAEVMSYTNAAGRRAMASTPGNAEIIDHEHREEKSHEIDEADTGRIQIGVATGEDEKTNYIIIVAVVAGITVIALGAYMVKKYFLK